MFAQGIFKSGLGLCLISLFRIDKMNSKIPQFTFILSLDKHCESRPCQANAQDVERPETEANKDLLCSGVGIPTLFFKCYLKDCYLEIVHKMFLVNQMFIFVTSISSKQTITFSIILYTFLFCEWVSTFKKIISVWKTGKRRKAQRKFFLLFTLQ